MRVIEHKDDAGDEVRYPRQRKAVPVAFIH